MTKTIIVHTSDICKDGTGDLKSLLNWLKVFQKFSNPNHEQHVMIFADDLDKVSKSLLSLAKAKPKHPIFKFFTIENEAIQPAIKNNIKIGSIKQSNSPSERIDLPSIFPHIKEQDVVNVFKISVSGNTIFKHSGKRIPTDKTFGILELDSLPIYTKTLDYSTLGLEENDLGLLHDIDGITGTENLEDYLEKLSPKTKQMLFQNEKISTAEATLLLAEIPIVFAYLFPAYDATVLEAALHSQIIKNAIKQRRKPLFFITNFHEGLKLPDSIQDAESKDDIRIVTTWLDDLEFENVNALFMNQNTQSIVIPSGDNTLIECIKAGKFPLYSHKCIPAEAIKQNPALILLRMSKGFNMSIFKSMLKILLANAEKAGWNSHLGFNNFQVVLKYLIQVNTATKPSQKAGVILGKFITEEMLSFFRVEFAPYLMKNFAFENKSLPRLISAIKTAKIKAGPTSSNCNTPLFDAAKAKPNDAPIANKKTKETTETTTEFGFKRGFLLKAKNTPS